MSHAHLVSPLGHFRGFAYGFDLVRDFLAGPFSHWLRFAFSLVIVYYAFASPRKGLIGLVNG